MLPRHVYILHPYLFISRTNSEPIFNMLVFKTLSIILISCAPSLALALPKESESECVDACISQYNSCSNSDPTFCPTQEELCETCCADPVLCTCKEPLF